jgi:hypothetical protein
MPCPYCVQNQLDRNAYIYVSQSSEQFSLYASKCSSTSLFSPSFGYKNTQCAILSLEMYIIKSGSIVCHC